MLMTIGLEMRKRCVGMLFKTWNMGGNHFVWWN